jgi:hypothetical protein
MNRRLISCLITGAGAALVVCAIVGYNQLAGRLATSNQAAATSGRPSGVVAQTQTAGGDTIALTAIPDPFGTYTFTVAVRNARGASLQGATVDVVLTMPDMQMAALRIPLPPISPPAPGAYQAQVALAAGRWQAVVRVLAPGARQPVQATFRFSAAS